MRILSFAVYIRQDDIHVIKGERMNQSERSEGTIKTEAWLRQKYDEIVKSGVGPCSLVCANIKQFRNLYTLHGKEKSAAPDAAN